MDWRSVVRGHSRIGRPSIKTESSGASQRRAMRAASVVLPLPVGPTIASVVPAGAFKMISRGDRKGGGEGKRGEIGGGRVLKKKKNKMVAVRTSVCSYEGSKTDGIAIHNFMIAYHQRDERLPSERKVHIVF